ncbi:UvrD-helicase domain-containing protein [Clostridium sp.]|uniref:HelD family protein n=1 Tax=Clostridium sp. TaxID=1506 RepID=UPI00290ABB48|nr:UvrD-helicase domain-containing protein [Clostridium sp.]MDU5105773.1 ATP-binding domain-containing protein [Clostridium sp.]
MDTKNKLIEEENKVLSDKIKLIDNKIKENDELIKRYSLEDINTYNKIDEAMLKKLIKEQNKLKNIKSNPYYGRLDIEYKDDNESKNIYIGLKGLEIDDNLVICSWAAPIGDIYENYGLGEYKHKYIDKKSGKKIILQGNITDKRKITIKKSKVVDVYSYTNYTEQDKENYTIDKIENSKTEKLGTIVETVERDQNKIIRLPIEKNILVQGCAGSGKSSVAFHRLAYLTYNYNLNDDEVLAITPNKIFQGYTSNILMELGTDFNVKQYTFKEFSEKVLNIEIKNKVISYDKKENKLDILKTSITFQSILDNYVKYLEENFIPEDNVIIDDFELINGRKIKALWMEEFSAYKINDRIDKFKEYLVNYLYKKLEEYINNIDKTYDNNMKILSKYSKSQTIYNNLIKKTNEEKSLKKERVRIQCKVIINAYIKNLKKIDATKAYTEMFINTDIFDNISRFNLTESEKDLFENYKIDNDINNIDSIPIMYLHYRINENKNKLRHIVIDECQDLSYLEIAVIEGLTDSFTFVGDFNQRIDVNKSTISLEQINNMFKKYTYFESYYLNKSFRNSKSITSFANEILQGYFINKESIPIAFNRETEMPKVYLNMGKEATIKAIAKNIENKSSLDKNIAIILKSEEEAKEYYNELSKIFKDKTINLIENEYCKYEKGINILSAKLSKGLEFDYVIIVDANEYEDNEDDRRLLYIAVTRALHQLEIYTQNKECFVTTIDNKLWERKYKLDTNLIIENLKKTIIQTLIYTFDNIPKEYIDYIESIDNYNDLTKFGEKLEGLEDINKLFEEEGIFINSNNRQSL